MGKLGKWLGIGLAIVVLLAIGAALGAGGSDDASDPPSADTRTVAPDRPADDDDLDGDGIPDADDPDPYGASADGSQTPAAEPAEPTPEPAPDGSYELNCDYVLGDFGESGDPEQGFRFVGGGEVENTGNVGIRTRVRIKWQLLGSGPVVEDRTVKVPVGGRRDVQVFVAATQDQIDLHQSADGDCSARASIVGTYGDAE